ncbi:MULTISPECIES: DoxX family protein [Brevibacillus]|uniref:DoxX family protein n=1 Tax=Brevibacillus porteri TaxID=2126350 RepID=A0ABX5FXN4_9BACL|nr:MULTISPECIES: DoxX family protein [Brevibacillus]MDC0759197.1 DoxX family protein [Brevibacillus sp. AG]MED1798680.1 DoxX family protein [Brevibacillus porteri]MED2131363.1 DoxX family protein [Brevibacillus porteri]MED2743917.1 DoxX family protein [Brevibacillus porteri]MED2813646.1 DoxX family protein [Brevibacillus porteri]
MIGLRIFAKWVMIVGLCLMFLSAGIYKLIGHQETTLAFQALGFPHWFQVVIGLGEVLGGLGLLMKKYARYAAYTLAVIMLGATITLLLRGDMTTVAIPFVLLLVFLLIGRQSGSKKQPNNATPI